MEIQQQGGHPTEPIVAHTTVSEWQADPDAPSVTQARTRPHIEWLPLLSLLAILLLGGYFRALSITDWDAGTGQHPDERFFTNVAATVRLPSGPGEFFDSARAPLNPRSYDQFPLYVYGPFPIYFTRMVAVTLTPSSVLPETVPTILYAPTGQTNYGPQIANPERSFPKLLPLQLIFNSDGVNLTTYEQIVKVGRSVALLFDLGSILLVYLIGTRLFETSCWPAGRVACGADRDADPAVALFVDPIFSTFFCLLTLYWAVRAAQGGGILVYSMLGLSIGVAMANRITMATLGGIAIVATLIAAWNTARNWRYLDEDDDTEPAIFSFDVWGFVDTLLSRGMPLLVLAGALTVFSYRTLQPDAFIGSQPDSPPVSGETIGPDFLQGLGFFDMRPDPRFLENLSTVRALVTGEYDFPPSQQWVARPAYLFPWQNMVLWGMGPALGLAAWIGWLLFGDVPQQAVLIGAAIVIGAGIYVIWREKQRGTLTSANREAGPSMSKGWRASPSPVGRQPLSARWQRCPSRRSSPGARCSMASRGSARASWPRRAGARRWSMARSRSPCWPRGGSRAHRGADRRFRRAR
ncbi:hypothetical protein HC891_18980, partial [Candidatus Gracilibacteria bacterium]|nr:hypothetical protein [Candidatus Gracilibacteria bacterium]